jgi:3'(2'), 5'-bisphosphate nucleotidase
MISIIRLIDIAEKAGTITLSFYQQASLEVMNKLDNTLLTKADLASHDYIFAALTALYPTIPIVSEESGEQASYATRKTWNQFFLIDPLDGTKEFIQGNGEFTVNIALIEKNQPILGIIHAPALGITYYAEKGKGAYKKIHDEVTQLSPTPNIQTQIRVAVSRSHSCAKTQTFLNSLATEGKEITTISKGSALKFGLIAEGSADIYPRFAPTMEWDTAAGHILVNELGKKVNLVDANTQLQYNKQVLINPGFIVQ